MTAQTCSGTVCVSLLINSDSVLRGGTSDASATHSQKIRPRTKSYGRRAQKVRTAHWPRAPPSSKVPTCAATAAFHRHGICLDACRVPGIGIWGVSSGGSECSAALLFVLALAVLALALGTHEVGASLIHGRLRRIPSLAGMLLTYTPNHEPYPYILLR